MSEVDTTQGRNVVLGMGLETDAGVAVTPTLFPTYETQNFVRNPNRQDFPGMNGSRSHNKQAVSEGNIDGRGSLSFRGRKQWLQHFLYWVMGGGSIVTPTLAEGAKTFTTEIDEVVRVLTLAGSKIGTLELTSTSNDPMMVNVNDVLAMSVTDAVAGTGTTPSRAITDAYLMHAGLTVTIDSGTVPCNSAMLAIENVLEDDHFQNSQSRTAIPEGDRIIRGQLVTDWNIANEVTRGMWTKFVSGAVAAIKMAWSDGTNTLTATMDEVIYQEGDRPMAADSRGTIFDTVDFQAKSSDAGESDELTVAWS